MKKMDERIAEVLQGRTFMLDQSSRIAAAMGGRDFFAEIEATAIHRVGLRAGLGWKMPPCNRGANYAIILNTDEKKDLFRVRFLKVDGHNEVGIEVLHDVNDVPLSEVRTVYDRETINVV